MSSIMSELCLRQGIRHLILWVSACKVVCSGRCCSRSTRSTWTALIISYSTAVRTTRIYSSSVHRKKVARLILHVLRTSNSVKINPVSILPSLHGWVNTFTYLLTYLLTYLHACGDWLHYHLITYVCMSLVSSTLLASSCSIWDAVHSIYS